MSRSLMRWTKVAKIAWRWRYVLLHTAAWCTASVILRPLFGEWLPQAMMRRYFAGVLRLLGIELEVQGRELLAGASPCVLIVNHNSLLDIPCIGSLLNFDYKWVSKKEIFRIPFVGWHLRACGHLWVDRSRRDNAARLEREFKRLLGRGSSILMFPEGTRSSNGALRPFRRGAFETAVREGVRVVPIALSGTEKLLGKGSLDFAWTRTRHVVRIRICPAIAPSVDASVVSLRDQTYSAIEQALQSLRSDASVHVS